MTKRDTPVLLITTAEELYGRHGVDAVSLRQIAEAAGQRNPAVVQYHFSTKQGLMRAIVEHRTFEPNRRRNEMLDELEAEGRLGDVQALLQCAVYPLVEQLPEYANFLRFMDQAHANHELSDIMWTLDDEHGSANRRMGRYLLDVMGDAPLAIKVNRLQIGFQLLLQALAMQVTKEQSGDEGILPNEVFYADMINAVSAFLMAPAPAIGTTDAAEAAAATAPVVTNT
ncbi:MAG: helix-turn-helix domain-containing protein [Acidimicrobiia bacterium]